MGLGHARRHLGTSWRQTALRGQQRQHHCRPDSSPQTYREYIGEAVQPSSYLKSPYYRRSAIPDGIYRVGPLARLNIANSMGTPEADEELELSSRSHGRGAVTSSFLYHYARLIEILAAIEWIEQMRG